LSGEWYFELATAICGVVVWLKYECHVYAVMLTTKVVLAKALYGICVGHVSLQVK